jgi:hypothetical protein
LKEDEKSKRKKENERNEEREKNGVVTTWSGENNLN